MTVESGYSGRLATMFVYGRVPLAFGALLCAINVMWSESAFLYALGVVFLLVSACFDVFSAWASSRNVTVPPLSDLADRLMDKVIYSIIFPAAAVGEMWRLYQGAGDPSRAERLHAIFILILCIVVMLRDNFAHFMRNFSVRKGEQPESRELATIRIVVAAPVAAILYAHAFHVPGLEDSALFSWLSVFDRMSLRILFLVEIVFLVINFGSMARSCRKHGALCLDEVCSEDDRLRFRILSFFPNSLTVMNAAMGLLAVFFAYQARIQEAFLIVIGAAFFDKLDGAVARKLGLVQPPDPEDDKPRISMGGILDDIADAISFCICPAWIFHIVISGLHRPVDFWVPASAAAIFYAAMGIARLVYFTLDKTPIPGMFKGLPTPGAALLVLAPVVILHENIVPWTDVSLFWAKFAFVWMIATGIMMNLYPVHYIHMGRFMDRHPKFAIACMSILFFFVFTEYFGQVALAFMTVYLLYPFISMATGRSAGG